MEMFCETMLVLINSGNGKKIDQIGNMGLSLKPERKFVVLWCRYSQPVQCNPLTSAH